MFALGLHPVFAQQKLPRAGRDFTFGIIEGPDNLPNAPASMIVMTVLSPYSGSGSVVSPQGFSQQFTFSSNVADTIVLPDTLMHLNDLGKTNKGLIVHTSVPVNIVLHDYAVAAGDATQILPDDALDTSYTVSAWGLYNDPQENNHCEFIVTAKHEGTFVQITPSVTTMLGQPANVPFTVSLNPGECYIVKADISVDSITSLSGSTVSSSAPVSVIAGTTCGYVPLGVESCNELMDELIGKKWWGNHFFVQPLSSLDSIIELVVTSDQNFSATINGAPTPSNGNRLQAELTGPNEIVTTAPAEVQQLTRGSTVAGRGVSDPTLVTILDVSEYADTLMFNSPDFNNSGFQHWTPIIFPTSEASAILLDGLALSSYPDPSTVINGGSMSAIAPNIGAGVHTIFSPVPVFALATGFATADAYSFIAGTVRSPQDTITQTVVSSTPVPNVELSVSVFPNPVTDHVTIAANEPLSSIQLIDPLGRILKTVLHPFATTTLDVKNVVAGSYFILATARDRTIPAQITIIR